MTDKKLLFIPLKSDNDYELLKKCIDLVNPIEGKEIGLNDLLSLDHFSLDEKHDLIRLLKGDYNFILTKDFTFYSKNDQWFCRKHDYRHSYITKMLYHMNNETKYRYNSAVHYSDLHLVELLIEQYNKFLEEDLADEIGEVVKGYEISQDMLQFISNCLKEETANDDSWMDYAFIRRFVEAVQKYDDLLVESFFSEENME